MYCFRVPFTMSELSLLDLAEPIFELAAQGSLRVWLASTVEEQPLRDALSIVIRGEGFGTEDAARAEGERWRDVVSRALARVHLAADFGDRRAYGQFTEAGRLWYSEQVGRPVLSDVPGVTAFLCDPALAFVRSEAKGCRRPSPEQSQAVFLAAASLASPLSEVERLAFDLYSGSFFQPSADARFLMLTMALETLLDLRARSEDVRVHVKSLIQFTQAASLTRTERDSIEGSLMWLYKESIGQAGRRLAQTLEPRRYSGLTPGAFFTRCYEMRSALVHGRVPRPDRSEVDALAANLEMFVGHLLSGELLVAFPD